MLHLWKLRKEIAAVLEKALCSILWIVESVKLMLLMNSLEKELVAIFSIQLCSIEIDLKDEGKTLEDRERVETSTNLMLIVGWFVFTFSWNSCCSKLSPATFLATKLLRLEKARPFTSAFSTSVNLRSRTGVPVRWDLRA